MVEKYFNERAPPRNLTVPRAFGLIRMVSPLIYLFGLLIGPAHCAGAEVDMTESKVKALFLFNFTKYVNWPPAVFHATNGPIIIGLIGEDRLGDALEKLVEGKRVSERQILIQPIKKNGDLGKCQILFISDSERKGLSEILDKIKTLPVLTVGETDQFIESGIMINFVKKEGKIRLEINLEAARQVRLEISAQLLRVADVVKGQAK
jgi:hypothetical protein